MGHQLSLPSLGRTVLLLTRSGMCFRHCSSLISLRIAKTVANACAQHAFIPWNTFCRYTRSVKLVKNEAHCLGPVSLFLNQWYKALSKCGYYLKNCLVRPTNTATFWPTKVTTFVWHLTIVADNLWYLSKWRPFWRPPIWLLPQMPGLDPPLTTTRHNEFGKYEKPSPK